MLTIVDRIGIIGTRSTSSLTSVARFSRLQSAILAYALQPNKLPFKLFRTDRNLLADRGSFEVRFGSNSGLEACCILTRHSDPEFDPTMGTRLSDHRVLSLQKRRKFSNSPVERRVHSDSLHSDSLHSDS